MRRQIPLITWLVLVLATAVNAATLAAGEVRTAEGPVAAVDVAHRAVVIEVPTPKGDLTVGVTLEDGVVPRASAAEVPLDQVRVGEKARLKYVRRDGRLVGLELEIRR